jgi:hypothetical protein
MEHEEQITEKKMSAQMKYLKSDKGKIANKKAQQKYYEKNKSLINAKRRAKYKEKRYGITDPIKIKEQNEKQN